MLQLRVLIVFAPSRCVADDIWLLPLSGCLSVRVHPVAPEGDSGAFTAPYVAMLWPRVSFTHMQVFPLKFICFDHRLLLFDYETKKSTIPTSCYSFQF